MKRIMIVIGACVVVFAGVFAIGLGYLHFKGDGGVSGNSGSAYNKEKENLEGLPVNQTGDSGGAIEVDTQPDSYTVLVNRDYPISKDYVPGDLVVPDVPFSFYGTYEKSYVREDAARALEKLFKGAQEKGYTLKAVSAYRSYERQTQIYENNLNTRGEEITNKVSAKPGTSEHQTGLAIDVSCDSVGCGLEENFGDTEEGKWLKNNCYKYGFAIRYPKDKTHITGYSYEPWHIRFVGKYLSRHLSENGITLEEYYNLAPMEDLEKEETVEDTDTNLKNEPQMPAAPTPRAVTVPTERPSYTSGPVQTASYAPRVDEEETPGKIQQPNWEETPRVTRRPQVTDTPGATQRPRVTDAPKVTEKPVATKKPEPTRKPVITEEEEQPERPKPTKVPEQPKPTKAPEKPKPPVIIEEQDEPESPEEEDGAGGDTE